MLKLPEKQSANPERRLVLGYDAGCMACSDLASRIEERVGDKLEVRSLHDLEVRQWRKEALGEDAPWAPTLFEVGGVKQVRAWTGATMALKLSWTLGPVASLHILQAIVGTKREGAADLLVAKATSGSPSGGLSRGKFLKQAGAGTLAATFVALGIGGLPSPASAAESSADGMGTAADRKKFDEAVRLTTKYIKVRKDGTLQLSDENVDSAIKAGRQKNIPAKTFHELATSLEVTNRQITDGKIPGGERLLTTGVLEVKQRSAQACRGYSGRAFYWWGVRIWLNSCDTSTLIYYCTIGAGAFGLCNRIRFIPCRVAAFILAVSCASYARAAAPGRGIVISKNWAYYFPSVYSQ